MTSTYASATDARLYDLLDIPNLLGKAQVVAELVRRGADRRQLDRRMAVRPGSPGRRSTDLPTEHLCECGFTHAIS